MRRFSRGSEWRKWDLHVHLPGTKLNNAYELKDGEVDWDQFCSIIHDSDVYAFGITDYFKMDGFFIFKKRYEALYPKCEKIFFPNLELRLNEAVNGSNEDVNFHILFRPDITQQQTDEFLINLKTQITNAQGKQKSCTNLENKDYTQATVTRDDIKSALKDTFGDESCWKDHVILLAAANNDGIRADSNSKRKMNIADQIDKFADAFFGNHSNSKYFLRSNRYEDPDQKSIPKPVFSGCDAHSFCNLRSWLGKEINEKDNMKCITWIKADLTFEGLQQTLIEPEERVRIQCFLPDQKEPYRVISKICFEDDSIFPKEVVFNPGLNAIIGSRSSGKSSLLAYIAHAINPEYTIKQQMSATGLRENEVGPGASINWSDVRHLKRRVDWISPTATNGQVIYIPQNSLYAISERPEEITDKIQPVVFRADPAFEARYTKALSDIENKNRSIRDEVTEWYSLNKTIKDIDDEIRDLGDRKAIVQRQKEIAEEIRTIQESVLLNEEEIKRYQDLIDIINANELKIKEIEEEQQLLSPYVQVDTSKGYTTNDQVKVNITVEPIPTAMPSTLNNKLQALIDKAQKELIKNIETLITEYRHELDVTYVELKTKNQNIQSENKELIDKNLVNTQLSKLHTALNEQKNTIAEIDKKVTVQKEKISRQKDVLSSIIADIKTRDLMLEMLTANFNQTSSRLENISFSIEIDYSQENVELVSAEFNKNTSSRYIKNNCVDIESVFTKIETFINDMADGTQKLNRGANNIQVTQNVFTVTKDVRFIAEMEGDRIGGFKKSSMTPGKQALFALTLILADSEELWPLLIDQPEDDLDSRSICDVIVKDLMKRKKERQIIMVTHDANLAIGADSEEIIVANRHGDDRQNKDGKIFEYLTGALEHSKPWDSKKTFILECGGIREHSCEILDGGVIAFQKRKDKYRI